MLSPTATDPVLQLLHMQGHVLNVLATFPGGLEPGSTIAKAVARLAPRVADLPSHVAVLDAAASVQTAIDEYTSATAEATDHAYANAISAFLIFTKKELALCPVHLH